MKTWKILVKGRVQKVGYRRIVDEVAYNLGINGHVRNLEDKKTVEVIAQHKDENILKKFAELIKVNEYPVKVEAVELQEIKEKEFASFEVIEGSLDVETRESIEAAVVHLRNLGKITKDGFSRVENKLESMDTKLESMDNKLESMDTKLESMDNKLESMDNKLENIDEKLEHGFAGTHKRLEKIDQTMSEQMVDLRQRVAKIEQVLHIK